MMLSRPTRHPNQSIFLSVLWTTCSCTDSDILWSGSSVFHTGDHITLHYSFCLRHPEKLFYQISYKSTLQNFNTRPPNQRWTRVCVADIQSEFINVLLSLWLCTKNMVPICDAFPLSIPPPDKFLAYYDSSDYTSVLFLPTLIPTIYYNEEPWFQVHLCCVSYKIFPLF